MLEHLQNKDEACYLMTELLPEIVMEGSSTRNKLDFVRRAVEHAKEPMVWEQALNYSVAMQIPELARIFRNTPLKIEDGSLVKAARAASAAELAGVLSYVAASSIIFAHSHFEYVLETLLKVTRLCDIRPWLADLAARERTIPIVVIINLRVEAALEEKLNEFVKALHKESLQKKIDYLARIVKTNLTQTRVQDYSYDSERLNRLDKLRHELAHHRMKSYRVEQADSDVEFLMKSSVHFFDVVGTHFGLQGKNRPPSVTDEPTH